jgi:beta-phosphoglucomutase family hydrolase
MATASDACRVVEINGSRYDAVVFDMDGVITDTAIVHAAAWKRMLDAYLLEREARTGEHQPPFDEHDYRMSVDGKHRDDGVASFLRSRGIDLPLGLSNDPPGSSSVWGLANRKNADFLQVLAAGGARAFPSSVSFVRDLQRLGIGTAIISASRNCQQVLDAAGIGNLFPVRVDGIETERLSLPGKPSPAVFVEAAQRLGASPARAVVVEDAVAGVQAGRAGDFALIVGVDRVGQAADLLANGADIVVRDLCQLRATSSDSTSNASSNASEMVAQPERQGPFGPTDATRRSA